MRSKSIAQSFFDGWQNVLTKLGSSKDKNTNTNYVRETFSFQQLENMYRDKLIQKIVDTHPFYMTKNWIDLKDSDNSDLVTAEHDRLNLRYKFFECVKAKRLYGGCIAFLGVDDGEADLAQPLNFNNIRSFNYINVIPSPYVSQVIINQDPTSENYLKSDLYMLQSGNVHKTRILEFNDKPSFLINTEFWGVSEIEKIKDYLMDFINVVRNTALLFPDMRLDIFSVEDLEQLLESDLFVKRWETLNKIKSILNSVIIDRKDTHTRINPNFANIDAIIGEYKGVLAGVVGLPQTLLWGEQQKGLSNQLEGDLNIFYGDCEAMQEMELTYHIDYVNKILSHLHFKQDIEIEWDFVPLQTADAKTDSDIRAQDAKTDEIYITNGIFSQEEVRAARCDIYGVDLADMMLPTSENEPTLPPVDNKLAEKVASTDSEIELIKKAFSELKQDVATKDDLKVITDKQQDDLADRLRDKLKL